MADDGEVCILNFISAQLLNAMFLKAFTVRRYLYLTGLEYTKYNFFGFDTIYFVHFIFTADITSNSSLVSCITLKPFFI